MIGIFIIIIITISVSYILISSIIIVDIKKDIVLLNDDKHSRYSSEQKFKVLVLSLLPKSLSWSLRLKSLSLSWSLCSKSWSWSLWLKSLLTSLIKLQPVCEERDLGVLVDSSLKFSHQCAKAVSVSSVVFYVAS